VTEGVAAKFAKVQASNTLRAWKRTDTYITWEYYDDHYKY
jgi:hypothetical protein